MIVVLRFGRAGRSSSARQIKQPFLASADIFEYTLSLSCKIAENGNDVNSYPFVVRRRPIYTVTYHTNGGTAVASERVEEDSFATEPTTTRTGYTFKAWNYDFTQPIVDNATISARIVKGGR